MRARFANLRLRNGLFRLSPCRQVCGKLRLRGPAEPVDLTLYISGNYLNNKSFLIKSDPITFAFPVPERAVFVFDSDGNQMGSVGAELLAATAAPGAAPPLLQAPPPASLAVPGSQTAPTSEDGLEQQLWFWSLVGAVSMLAAAALWWFLKPSIVLTTLPEAVAELTEMVSLATEPA